MLCVVFFSFVFRTSDLRLKVLSLTASFSLKTRPNMRA